jgi:tRNA A37 methylthiotransferase MiaB
MKQVNDTVKHNRVNEVLALSDKLEHDYYEKNKGKVVEVLSESGNDGFTSNYIKIHFDKYVEPNKFVNVLITDVDGKTVNGQVM